MHVHTPFSLVNNYGGNDDATWEKFISDLESLPKEFSVLGINDYLFIDGYKKVLEYKKEGRLVNIDTIFPVIEFRIKKFCGHQKLKRINFHVILSDELQPQIIEQQFLSQLYGKHKLAPGLDGIEWKGIVTLEALADLGCKIKETIPTDKIGDYGSDIQEGFNNINFEEDKIFELLKSSTYLKDYFLTAIGKTEWGAFSWGDSSIAEKKTIINSVDFVFTASESIDAFNRAKQKLTEEKVNDLLLDCSDAHRFSNDTSSKDRIGNCFTWVKSDPTFEGLKQIVYEPEDRVKIQELKPEEKEDYQVIDKVKFIDESFTPDEILINQNLTIIIGGKSTGKSILLRNIAQTIDSVEVPKRLKEVNLNFPEYSKKVSDFNVVWRDKQENKKNEDNEVKKKIIYIPQSYLNRLVDKEGKTLIDDIIENVLKQEEYVKTIFSELKNQDRSVETNITQNIEDLFYKEKDIENLSEDIKKIGDKKGIESEIGKLKEEVAGLKGKSGMSTSDIDKYNNLSEKITNLKNAKERKGEDKKSLDILKSQKNFVISIENKNILDLLDTDIQKVLREGLDTIIKEAEVKWREQLDIEYKKLVEQEVETQDELTELCKSFSPILEKVKKSESLDEKIKKLEEEENKLKEITNQEKNYETLKNEYDDLLKNITEKHSKFFDNFYDAKTEISKQRSITEDQDLEFGIEVVFENKSFQEKCINDICDRRKLSQFEDVSLQNYKYSNNIDFKNDMEKILKGILNGKVTLISSYSKKEAITKLVQNWFVFDYKIKQNGDEISEMSPGKRSFVLLKLLIELDNSKCPILLDQPEDDLDNRSIYYDLVKFIKRKKKERQIIIVTHNPNLVVGADSECIIVANQEGDKSKNKTYKFEYVQGSLENKFYIQEEERVLYKQGIQGHVCDILEGGEEAFEKRKHKYHFT